MEQLTEKKTCLNCGEGVGAGRRDKKYCSEACRTAYHNRGGGERKTGVPLYTERIIGILLRNRDILDGCLKESGCCRLARRDVVGRGFNFKYFTSMAMTGAQEAYYFCFEVGYKETGNGMLLLVRREREIIC